jgi:mutator protein MutT
MVPQMPVITVVAAVIHRDGRYLLCRRPAHKRHGGLWEFPGGKLLDGESLEGGVRRELVEELHVEPVRVGEVRSAIADPGSPFVITFVEVEIVGEPCSAEHEAIAWVAAPDLLGYPLAPSDRAFAESLTVGS